MDITCFIDPLMAMPGFLDGMGAPAIDQHLVGVLDKLDEYARLHFQPLVYLATKLSQIFVMLMLSWECIQMIGGYRMWTLGRVLRPLGLMMAISFFPSVASIVRTPGESLVKPAKETADKWNQKVEDKQKEVAKISTVYLDSLSNRIDDNIQKEKDALSKDQTWLESLITGVQLDLEGEAKKLVATAQTKAIETLNKVIRVVAEFVWQASYYGIFILYKYAMVILYMFGPVAFAISIVPPFSSAWSTWIARYVNLSWYGFLIFMCIAMIDQMFLYSLGKDIEIYKGLLGGADYGTEWTDIKVLGMNQIGTTTAYVAAMLAGSYALRMVPEVASWIMPADAGGGISAAAQGFAQKAAMPAQKAAAAPIKAAGRGVQIAGQKAAEGIQAGGSALGTAVAGPVGGVVGGAVGKVAGATIKAAGAVGGMALSKAGDKAGDALFGQ